VVYWFANVRDSRRVEDGGGFLGAAHPGLGAGQEGGERVVYRGIRVGSSRPRTGRCFLEYALVDSVERWPRVWDPR